MKVSDRISAKRYDQTTAWAGVRQPPDGAPGKNDAR
jgi:hypothetical protein